MSLDLDTSPQRWGGLYRQVLLAKQTESGMQYVITWLPIKNLKVGIQCGDMIVHTIYSYAMKKCKGCNRLCFIEVTDCWCYG